MTLGNYSAQIDVNPATNTSLCKRFCMSQITELPIMEARAKDTFNLLLLQVQFSYNRIDRNRFRQVLAVLQMFISIKNLLKSNEIGKEISEST